MLTRYNVRLALAVERQCVGGMGVSGGPEADGVLVARAGVEALERFAL